MYDEIAPYVLVPTAAEVPSGERHRVTRRAGAKAAGLRLIPLAWTPPYVAISADLYAAWSASGVRRRRDLIRGVAASAFSAARRWAAEWPTGILVRSSAVEETLAERGANETHTLPADYRVDDLATAVAKIYQGFAGSEAGGAMALVIQARVPVLALGHMSNERRVSKTINHWMWELEGATPIGGRFNSQRERLPPQDRPLSFDSFHNENLMRRLKQVGLWSTRLNVGPCHIEWGASQEAAWVLQLDIEDDQPDPGFDPNVLLVGDEGEYEVGIVPAGSPFKVADFGILTGWRKLDKVRDLVLGENEKYPELLWITGDEFSLADQTRPLEADLGSFSSGRIVVRTDCIDPRVPALNLPRTDSVSAAEAVLFMRSTVETLGALGTAPSDVAFIIHRFIPAGAAAWALAYPDRQIVLVDSLWGLPDGLQYLPHDTFQFDVRLGKISAEKLRYKPAFLQETPDGTWRTVKVRRDLGRRRSLSAKDVSEVASRTHAISAHLSKPIQVMWFSRIPEFLKIGANIPWFSLPPESEKESRTCATPGKFMLRIRTFRDLDSVESSEAEDATMVVEPEEADLFRNNAFLERIADLAQAKGYSVCLSGSTLSHAFYLLERKGVPVIQLDSIGRSRTRNRRVFKKLVRDDIPTRIVSQGENVTLAQVAEQESRLALVTKLFEEAHELISASERSDVAAELADIYEIVRALCVVTGVSLPEVEEAAAEKREKRGGFEKNVVLIQTSWPALEGKPASTGSPTVRLSELAEIQQEGDSHHVSYPGIVGPGARARLRLRNGTVIEVKLDGSGVALRELADDGEQPSLPLDT